MQYDHRVLGNLRRDLEQTQAFSRAQRLAAELWRLFSVHAEKENRFVLAALEPMPDVDLPATLAAMHRRIASPPVG